MKLLFWNLGRKDNKEIAKEAIVSKDVDIAIFAEYGETDCNDVANRLGSQYKCYDGYGGCDKICLIAKRNYSVVVNCEATRYVIYYVQDESNRFIVGATHMPAPPRATKEDRKKVIRDLIQDIQNAEKDYRCDNTIIVGDLNASPFDEELVQKDCFNAVLFKDLILKQEYVQSNGTTYRRFYNPVIDCISEENKSYGSYYYATGINSLYWYSFDQALFRKTLISTFDHIEYLKSIADYNLLTENGIPNKTSDHLPLYIEMR